MQKQLNFRIQLLQKFPVIIAQGNFIIKSLVFNKNTSENIRIVEKAEIPSASADTCTPTLQEIYR